jgi:hypothetical protein
LQWQGTAGGMRQHNLSKETCSWNNWEIWKGKPETVFFHKKLIRGYEDWT